MDPPPLPSQPTSAAAAIQPNHPDSANNSSPRTRPTDTASSDVVDALPPVPNPKLRLMCSYGGHIIPRPHDKSLCYVGGDTRMVVVDRHGNSSLSALSSRLSRTLLNGRRFTLKYQLPHEDLDSLISVATDEDLDNMFEEYDRITTSAPSSLKPGRLRLFLFFAKPETAASMGSLLDDAKSETWFVDALNGTGFDLPRGLSESAVMDCLVELDDEGDDGDEAVNVDARAEVDCDSDNNNKGTNNNVHHVVGVMPDSPLVETGSSFGSSSSSPSMSNLPPIKVRVEGEGCGGGAQMVGLDEQFLHMNVAQPSLPTVIGGGVQAVGLDEQFLHMRVAQPPPLPMFTGSDEQFVHMNPAMPPLPTVIGGTVVPSGGASAVTASDDERSDQGATTGFRKPPLPLQPVQRRTADICSLRSPDSVASDSSIASATLSKHTAYQEPSYVATGDITAPAVPIERKTNSPDPSSQQLHESAYMLPPQQIQQQQQQFVYTNQHYVHHPVTGQQVPISSYYQMYAPPPSQPQKLHHQVDQQYQQYPMYYYPVTQAIPSNSTTIPSSAVYNEPNPTTYMTKTATQEVTGHVNRNVATATPPLVQVPSNQYQQQYMGVPQMHHHPSQSIAGNYGYEYPPQTHEQVYYTQHPAAPMPPQYQTMTPATAVFLSQAAAQLPSDTTTQHNRNTQQL